MSHADVNGLSLYYEEHGSGEPLVLLHGGIGAGELLAPIVPALAAARRVIAVDLPGHGHSPYVDRPLRAETMADDIAALIEHLGLGQTDLMGYSLGGLVSLRTAIQHPALVRRLVLVSIPFRRDGSHPEVLDAMDAMSVDAAELIKQSPLGELYSRIAPRPEDWTSLIARTAEGIKVDYDWTEEVRGLEMPTLLVFADADSVRPAHIVEFYGLLGGGLRDAGWDHSHRPVNQLAILPGTTHYDISTAPALVPTVLPFLEAS
jgi:pimeloyl-ACP methyl ester carboxylesterase